MTLTSAEIRRRALLAAAKVTLSLSALACSDTESTLTSTLSPDGAAGQNAAGQAGTASGQAGTPAQGQGGALAGAAVSGQAGQGGGGQASAGAAGQAAEGGGAGAGGQAVGAGGAGGVAVFVMTCDLPATGPYPDEVVACCTALVAPVLPPWADFSQPEPERPASIDDATLACCEVLVAANDASTETFDQTTRQQAVVCCPYLQPFEQEFLGVTCTPWGPPMPPEMPAHLFATAEAWA